METTFMDIEKNVAAVRARIADAAAEAGRNPSDILLVAASKMNGAERVRRAVSAGVDACGENRVQEFLEKNAQGAYTGCPVHLIGHLQKNKVKQAVGAFDLIESVDSEALLRLIGGRAETLGIVQDVLIELNIADEDSKSGLAPALLPQILEAAAELPSIRVRGLMAIPPISTKVGKNRPYFAQMQELFIDIRSKKYDNISMDFLSMGMSGDFEDAVREGANMVRVGSAIFGARHYGL
ncbi:MAG: YggS family pyridoxal phosphate-dependent enzyme [Eubacteriales bacterium]|nr:YggS family pyridoxal phosphate-dependent enzyme [Eubacteriales bacterium]